MKEWLTFITENAVMIINAIALIIVVIGTIEAFFESMRAVLSRSESGRRLRGAYLIYARWLVAGLTFQLAADIIATTIAPTWQEIGRLGAIAVIRTFLNFFLERDLGEVAARKSVAAFENVKKSR
jgi:uncharacterized membrane protein